MENDDFTNRSRNLANNFEIVFQRLLSGEKFNLYEEDVSLMFEVIAANLLAEIPERKYCWYDGVYDLIASVRKSRQIEFNGEMWVGDIGDVRTQWKEKFQATVTDKRITKQGIWVVIWINYNKAEGELSTALGITE